MKAIVLLILMLINCSVLFCEPVRVSSWHYYKKISGLNQDRESRDWMALLEIDPEVSKYRFANDLRIMYGKRELPYITRYARLESRLSQKVPVEVIFEKTLKETKVLMIKLPEIGEQESLQRLEFNLPQSFDGEVELSWGLHPDHLDAGSQQRLFHYYNGEKQSALVLPGLKKQKYLRVEYKNNAGVYPVGFYKIPDNKYLDLELDDNDGKFSIDQADNNSVLIKIPNANRRPIYRIELKFKEIRYSRPYTLYSYNDQSREFMEEFQGRLQSKNSSSDIQHILLNRTTFEPLRIKIENANDQPLHLEKIRVYAPREEMIIKIPDMSTMDDATLKENLLLYYGNAYAPKPVYDFGDTYEDSLKSEKMVLLKAGAQIKNPEFAYSLIEPPLSIYLIRILMVLGIALTIYPAYKTFRGLKSTKEPESNEDLQVKR